MKDSVFPVILSPSYHVSLVGRISLTFVKNTQAIYIRSHGLENTVFLFIDHVIYLLSFF